MRIIAGSARGRRLQTLPGQDTRPTLERVKEGMFSAVQFGLPGAAVLDLYAGNGQLGLEALSRGAAVCTFVDNAKGAVEIIRQNAASTGLQARCRIVRQSAEAFVQSTADRFDLLLLDPPYRSGALPALLEGLGRCCRPGAVVLCESPAGMRFPGRIGAF